MVKVGIIGVGTVGSSVAIALEENKKIITARAGKEIVVKKGVVKDKSKTRPEVKIPISQDINDVLDDPEIDIVIELMGGKDLAFEVHKKALLKGKAVVTANKYLLAYHRYELQKIAGDIPYGFEASVAGGIPIIKALRDGLSANHIESIWGIINGTSNYILTKMMKEETSYENALKEAQELGYAEADPTFDVGGFDAAHKLLILSSIAYGIDAKPEDILIEGIEEIGKEDIEFAKDFDYNIKLLAIANKVDNFVDMRVHPVLIKKDEMIAKVDGVTNAVSVLGDKVGETLYVGPGAGGDATASAVISDLIEIVRNNKSSPMLGFKFPMEEGLSLLPKDKIECKYYLRLNVVDKPGVLAKIANLLGAQGISIEALLQKPDKQKNSANILLSTHKTRESSIKMAINELERLDVILAKPFKIRIEE